MRGMRTILRLPRRLLCTAEWLLLPFPLMNALVVACVLFAMGVELFGSILYRIALAVEYYAILGCDDVFRRLDRIDEFLSRYS